MPWTKEEKEKHDAEIKAWLDKGNKITICEPGERSEVASVGRWGKKKAQPKTEDTADKK